MLHIHISWNNTEQKPEVIVAKLLTSNVSQNYILTVKTFNASNKHIQNKKNSDEYNFFFFYYVIHKTNI